MRLNMKRLITIAALSVAVGYYLYLEMTDLQTLFKFLSMLDAYMGIYLIFKSM